MSQIFVGIDLGTTNSVISSYDGDEVKVYRSPEQHTVTPSAIYVDRRSRYYGARAYRMSALAPDNTATNFKRLMGTSTPIRIRAMDLSMTPEECSAEILRVMFGYLPEEVRNDPETGTVITVPAAFNQMQKDSTMAAAAMAGIGRVALMQEPVAAVMSVMRRRRNDGTFVVFDMGGGTLDVALAESVAGRVTLHEHGGVAMCGGRDFDRIIVEHVVLPWLLATFSLPKNISADPSYQSLVRLAGWASEQAKIGLASNESVVISLPESEVRTKDLNGREIYIDVELDRKTLDGLIGSKVTEAADAVNDALRKAHLTNEDVEKIVFVGGPTQYKPLRDTVCRLLGIPGNTDVDPMTAVAEGASVFSESIDWSSAHRPRKSSRGTVSAQGAVDVKLKYQSRTPDVKASVLLEVQGEPGGSASYQIDSTDSGWSSGRMALKNGAAVAVPLTRAGENRFKVFLFDRDGGPMKLDTDTIVITRTAATIDAIPASHSIGVAAKDRIGGKTRLDYLVRAGEPLPKKGAKTFRAEETLRAGGRGAIVVSLWEGEIEDSYTDNRPVGSLKILGSDFDIGVIRPNDEIICEYEVLDSGAISISVSVPSISGTFSPGHNFYSRQEGLIDYSNAAELVRRETEKARTRVEQIASVVEDENLDKAADRLAENDHLESLAPDDAESLKQGMDNVLEVRRLLAQVSKGHRREIREIRLREAIERFDEYVREHATPAESTSFDNLARSARSVMDRPGNDFEIALDEMEALHMGILVRQDWFVINYFNRARQEPWRFSDRAKYAELCSAGDIALQRDDIPTLRTICGELSSISIGLDTSGDFESVNIVRN